MSRNEDLKKVNAKKPMQAGPRHMMGGKKEKAKDARGTLKRLWKLLLPHKYAIYFVFFAAILSTIFNIVGPKILGLATTELFKGMMSRMQGLSYGIDFDYILVIVAILVGLYTVSGLFSYLMNYIMVGVTQKTVFKLRSQVNEKLERLPLKYYDQNSTGDVLSRVTNDIDTVASTLQQTLVQLITSLITIIGSIVMMLTISFWLTLIALVTIPLTIVIIKNVVSRSQKYFAQQQKSLGKLNGHVEEMISGHTVVKLFNYEDESLKTFNESNEELYESGWKAQFLSGIIMPSLKFVSNIGYVLVTVVGGIFVTLGTMTVGNVQAFITYSQQFSRPISQSANMVNLIQAAIAALERVYEVLDAPEESEEKEVDLVVENGEVEFKDVKFGYVEDQEIIHNLSVTVEPGQVVAIVGPTGAGKTTLVNLLMRFYDIDGGTITIEGQDINDFSRGSLRDSIGMVLQDTWLFNGTIRDNIKYGREDATDEEMITAAKHARVDHFIRTLSDGYDTVLNEEASNISQGQKQLITIARAILRDPKILILDEATSNVDTKTEVDIKHAMNTLMSNRTSFVIAHRLSTIRDADQIFVMDQGDIIEFGTHKDLIAQGGFYNNLYMSQFLGNEV